MRLFLSSYRFGKYSKQLASIVDGNQVAVIANAQDSKEPTARHERVKQEIVELGMLGFDAEELDLRNYFTKKITENDLKKYDLIWVRGGNVFNLRRAFKQSGFDAVITKLIIDNNIAYGGYSAGVCVLSQTLRGIELCDPTDDVPEGYNKTVLWDGLGILEYSIAPHYKSNHYESEMVDKVVAYMEKEDIAYKPLRDGEVILVNANKQELLK